MKKQTGSKRSKGFRIGKNKPGVSQSVYLGKAEKIKKTLIHKAKLKKQRAKELVKAGYNNTVTEPEPENNTDDQASKNDNDNQTKKHTDSIGSRSSKKSSGRHLPQQNKAFNSTKSDLDSSTPEQRSSHKSHHHHENILLDSSHPTIQSSKTKHNKPPTAKSQHLNGQPKMSHRVSKILYKLEMEKQNDLQPH